MVKIVFFFLNIVDLPKDVDMSIVQPATVGLQLATNVSVKAGTRVTFACRSSNSYPQADIAWFKNSFSMMLDSNAHVQTNLTYELNGNNEFDTISYLSFDVISSDHLREVRCDVKVGNMQRVMHGSIILDVKCKF